MFKKRAGRALLGIAVVALLVGVAATFWPTEAPRPQTLEFSVQCLDGSKPSEVRVETPNDEGRAEQTGSDPYNTHYGTFKYAVTDVNTKYSLRVTCVRRDIDPSVKFEKDYTLTSRSAAWGNAQNFGCNNAWKVCEPLASNEITLTVYCGWDVTATEVFVVPQVNAAGSARRASSKIVQLYTFLLASPITRYSIEVTCTPSQGKAWAAKSNPNEPAIGSAHFGCGRPVDDKAGVCTHW